jgi:hypothetical protein
MRSMVGRRPGAFPLVVAGVVLFFAVESVAILVAGSGSFTYTLDDPYIHLALSEQLRHGGYGINPGEAATPSSSVLWPFLLVPTAGTILHVGTPLVLALLATLASGWLMLRGIDLATGGASDRRPVATAGLVLAPLVLLNWAGVAFTGMEHSAHITATLAVSVGLVQVATGGRLPWWLIAGLVAGPLLRYEGLAVTVAGAAVLAWWGHRAVAALSVAGAVVPLAAFSLWNVARGLDALPSSVLVKSDLARGSGGTLGDLTSAVLDAVGHPVFAVLVVAILGHALVGLRLTALHGYALAVLAGHAVAGQFGWFSRYELYAYAAVLPVAAFLARLPLQRLLESRASGRYVAVAAALVAAVGFGYVRDVERIPAASANIYSQQVQMARFVSEYWPEPVAVNDLGLVAYRSDRYVLDLWGLASQEAREARSTARGPDWMERLADEHGVTLVMIYSGDWFPEVPDSWVPVASLSLDIPRITVGGTEVTFLATSPDDAEAVRSALQSFAPTLPTGASMEWVGDSP